MTVLDYSLRLRTTLADTDGDKEWREAPADHASGAHDAAVTNPHAIENSDTVADPDIPADPDALRPSGENWPFSQEPAGGDGQRTVR